MTELLITPNFDKKTAKAKGAVAAGEHISVTIENASDIDTASLRLRVISLSGKTLAMFQPTLEPDEDGQTYAWGFADNGGISCELNLNTVQMQESVCGMCETDFELVLDDPKAHTLYFKGLLSVQGWPKKEGAEAPYDLDGFPALIDDWTEQLDNMELSAKRVEGGVEIVAWDGKGEKPDGVVVKDGSEGPKGETGDKGNGIAKIELVGKNADGDNVYKVTMDDGSTYELTMPKGPKGDSGGVTAEEFLAEVKRATDREDEIDDKVKTLVGITEGDGGKSVRRIAREEVGRVVDGAPEAFNTLNEISKYIEEDQTGAAAMAKAIADNRASIDNEIARSIKADDALAARTKTLEDLSAETVKKLANKADTTAVAKALGTKADKKDIPSLSSYATEKYVNDKVAEIPAGTTDYNELKNLPNINGKELSGNKTAEDLGLASAEDLSGYVKKTASGGVSLNLQYNEDMENAPLFLEIEGAVKMGQLSEAGDEALLEMQAGGRPGGFKVYVSPSYDESTGKEVSRTIVSIDDIKDVTAELRKIPAKRDRTDNTAAKDEAMFSEWKFHCDEPAIQAALDANPPTLRYDNTYEPLWGCLFPEVEGYSFDTHPVKDVFADINATYLDFKTIYAGLEYKEDGTRDLYSVTATRTKTVFTKSDEPYVTPTGVKNIAIPKYDFVDAAVDGGIATLAPYAYNNIVSDGTAFTVSIGGELGKARDCALVVEVPEGTTAPNITWGVEGGAQEFDGRTDAETDMVCEVGVNVYWLTEYAPNQFVVARWHKEVKS